ncbi:MAG: transposase [Cyanobacteriota bacterium]
MQSPDDPELRAEIRQRMSPPNRESVAEIARSTGVNAQTLYSWRHRWKQEGLLVPATSKAPEEWSAADKLAAVIQAAGLSGADLGAYCRERGLFPKQLARWRQVAEDANNHSWRPGEWCKSPGTPTPASPGWAAHLSRLVPRLALQGVGRSVSLV